MSDNAINIDPVGGDVLIFKGDPAVVVDSRSVTNNAGYDYVLPAGYPMVGDVPCPTILVASSVDGVVYKKARLAAGETARVSVLSRGPAAVNRDALADVDIAGNSISLAHYQSGLEANTNITVRTEPEQEERVS